MGTTRPARFADRLRRGRRAERHRAARRADAPGSSLGDLIVITGFSGAGKSTAMAACEDAGYFCVDNLPPEMIGSLADLFVHDGSSVERAAVVCDVRGGSYFDGLVAVLDDLAAAGVAQRMVFLRADEQALLDRYQETRRRHPLARAGQVAEGIRSEAALLAPLERRADTVIDTTGVGPATLRRRIADDVLPTRAAGRLALTFQSFGHKHGPVRGADLAFDCRFLPNPHYEDELRALTGRDVRVAEYVAGDGALAELYAHLEPLLDYLLPRYVAEGKAHLTVAIGCTGGRHRSVVIAEHLAARYCAGGEYLVEVVHRDIDRPPAR